MKISLGITYILSTQISNQRLNSLLLRFLPSYALSKWKFFPASMGDRNVYVMSDFDQRVMHGSIVCRLFNFCAVCMRQVLAFHSTWGHAFKGTYIPVFTDIVSRILYFSYCIWTVTALCYLVLVSSFVFCIDSAFRFPPDSTFSFINTIMQRWQDDKVNHLLKTCSNCCRDINGKLEPTASSYVKLCILYLQFTFTY